MNAFSNIISDFVRYTLVLVYGIGIALLLLLPQDATMANLLRIGFVTIGAVFLHILLIVRDIRAAYLEADD